MEFKKRNAAILAILVAFALAVPNAMADEEFEGSKAGDLEFTLGGAGANDQDFDVGGGAVEASLGYLLSDNLQFTLRQRASFADAGESTWNGSTRAAIDFLIPIGPVRPFVGANLGYVYGDTVDETFAAAPEVGVKWWVTQSAFVFGMAEYQFFFEDTDDADDAFEDGSFVYSVGIGIHF